MCMRGFDIGVKHEAEEAAGKGLHNIIQYVPLTVAFWDWKVI